MGATKKKGSSKSIGRKSAAKVEEQSSRLEDHLQMDTDDVQMVDSNSSIMKKLELLKNRGYSLDLTLKLISENPGLLVAILDGLCSYVNHIQVTVALSKLVWCYPTAQRFAQDYFTTHGSPLQRIEAQLKQLTLDEPQRKKLKSTSSSKKTTNLVNVSSEEALAEYMKAVFILMKKLPSHIYSSWNLKDFIAFKSMDNKLIRWYTVNCISLLLRLSEAEHKNLIRSWSIQLSDDLTNSLDLQREIEILQDNFLITSHGDLSPHEEITVLDETSRLTSIGGLIVKTKLRAENQKDQYVTEDVVPVPSFIQSVKEIALNVTNCSPVCVVGPIGSGKSTLIRYVASVFGRIGYPDFISVQMSDQVDSRLLLGSYHSTDLPGQFVWKPGCLTKAVLNGHWIVFEDLDSAPMDVITLLDGFIDSKRLSVPGYGEIDHIHPDFRVFASCRTHNSRLGKSFDSVGKCWEKIFINPYSSEELKSMVKSLYEHLQPIADRLVDTFEAMKELTKDKRADFSSSRPVSVRDFLKFCRRIPEHLDFTQTSTAITIFQEALDLFVAALTRQALKETVSEVIGTHLNLLKSKTEYYLTMYKPHVSICNRSNSLICGRFSLAMYKPSPNVNRDLEVYSITKRTCSMLETISGAVKNKEPLLLVGETGVGKTSCIQYLAKVLHQKLVVVNLNRQSDSADLLGGYKPVELKYIFLPLREEFEDLFAETFNKDANTKYLNHIMTCYANKRWKDLVKLMRHVEKSAISRSRSISRKDLLDRWTILNRKLSRVEAQIFEGEESPFAFSFIEGTLISAIRNGYWILLDEINLATSEMLQCLSGVLDEKAQIHLWEKGDEQPIQRHENFHLFAAMNPSTDVGKKDLPLGIRNRLSELYVGELTDADELRILVSDYLKEMSLSGGQIDSIVQFYLKIRSMSQSTLVDGLGKKPHFSLRTLCRALKISSMNLYGSISRSLYESFCLSFLTQLDFASHPVVENLIAKHIFGRTDVKSIVNQPLPCPVNGKFNKVEGYWIPQGDSEPKVPDKYILTTSVRRNLKDIARIVSAGKLPVLIQGETSVGKTSLIQYLADCSGNTCYRINNHQHTDLQEYVGSYQSDKNGKLVFTEGVLVQAMRRGEWIILDELNLAPSEVLEALNRLLDDNRQLFITETGVTVTAHSRFMLFATQNPPGLYGGRKILSRAFRNRFVELHFDEIPSIELENILHLRCAIPVSYCKKIIGVMKDLQIRRKSSAALQGKHGFATLRDLFRWAERYRLSGEQKTKFYDWDQHIADEGYLVLAGKERKFIEADVIREVLEKNFKRKVDPNHLFSLHEKTSPVSREILEVVLNANLPEFRHIVWTYQMRRLAVLIGNAMKFKEPILLVGETGCGKTTVVQLLSQLRGRELFTINCHMNSEGSDFLGGLRPVRDHSEKTERLFEWVDGPLVGAMESGGIFLADEISLADDSVLERINSVLEPERTLLIAEKGGETPKLVVADERFHFVGTMNPGGDYGKKELSPALRNRLTEIWCELSSEEEDLISIVEHNLIHNLKQRNIGLVMTSFMTWLKNNELGQRCTISIRDYLSWVNFVNHMTSYTQPEHRIAVADAIEHGACLSFLDGLGTGNTSTDNHTLSLEVRHNATDFLRNLILEKVGEKTGDSKDYKLRLDNTQITVGPFAICRHTSATNCESPSRFALEAPTTLKNTLRVLRAMQLKKPILLEGSPGVGKTALVVALASITNQLVTRINLSEQTDISDLFGADLPVEGKEGGHFEWRDGPLLQALKTNSWILLDELNLASQSVLEGLNACLDHRGSVFVPELNKTFKIFESEDSPNFSRIFGCQNPVRQGGARKGLPKSFLNRFTQVYIDSLTVHDFKFVVYNSFPLLSTLEIDAMSTFADRLHQQVCQRGLFGAKGSPWDINLRDLMRWAQLTVNVTENENLKLKEGFSPELYVDLIYGLRMRCLEDRKKVLELYCKVHSEFYPEKKMNLNELLWGQNEMILLKDRVICGKAVLERNGCPEFNERNLLVLQKDLAQLEAIMACLKTRWMPILVGPVGSGKTSLVKLVTQLCGRKLQIMHPSPEMDTIELLGGFEQADIYRRIDEVRVEISGILLKHVKKLTLSNGTEDNGISREILELWSSTKALPHISPEGLGHDEEIKKIRGRVDFLKTAYLRCKSFSESESCNPGMLPYENEEKDGESTDRAEEHEHLERVSRELEQIYTHLKAGIQTGAFQWIDSVLIKALLNGEWILIDGANRCSAAVLDRLNSLMEPNGSILLSERGSIDGKIVEIKPHPEFRLILALDPIYGEISRAMRNRGVEIYMSCGESLDSHVIVNDDVDIGNDNKIVSRALGWTDGDITPALREFGINFFDLDALLRAEGLRDRVLRREIVNLHREIRDTVASSIGFIDEHAQLFKVISSTKFIVLQLQQGICLSETVRRAFLHAYAKCGNVDKELCNLIETVTARLTDKENSCSLSPWSSKVTGELPILPVSLPNFMNSQLYRVWKHLEVLESCEDLKSSLTDNQYGRKSRKELLQDFLILSVFSKVIKQDARALSIALGLRYPLKASFVGKLANVLDSTEFESLVNWKQQSWDIQELPHVIAKFSRTNGSEENRHLLKTLKVSLRLYYQNQMFHDNSWQIPKKGTLAFVAKNVKFSEAGPLSEFLHCFWNVVVNFNSVVESCLIERSSSVRDDVGEKQIEEYAKMWLDGMKVFLWGKRLQTLVDEKCISKVPNEKVIANMNLLIQWISDYVVPTLAEIGGSSPKTEMIQLTEQCFKIFDHCRDRNLLQRNTICRQINEFQPFLTNENVTFIEPLMEVLFAAWSCDDTIEKSQLIKFLTTERTQAIHDGLSVICMKTLANETLTKDDLTLLTHVRDELSRLKSFSPEVLPVEDSHTEAVVNLFALEEFLRISGDFNKACSTFVNPFLQACKSSNGNQDVLIRFFEWQDTERFRQTVLKIQIGRIENACLLPLFAGRIILDCTKRAYKVPSLESNGVVENCQRKLLSILSSETTKHYNPSKMTVNSSSKLCEDFGEVLRNWRKVFIDSPSQMSMLDEWGLKLAAIKQKCLDKKKKYENMAMIGAIMVEASSCLMEVASCLPAVDPVVEKEVSAKYLNEEIVFFESWILSKRLHQLSLTGIDIMTQNMDSTMHPYLGQVAEDIALSKKLREEALAGIVPRPEPPSYSSILGDIKQFVGTLGSLTKIKDLTNLAVKLFEVNDEETKGHINSVLIQCVNWLDSHRNFARKIARNYWYWDVTAGFLFASMQASVGFNLICDAIRRSYLCPASEMKHNVLSLVQFPRPYKEISVNPSGLYEEVWAYQRARKRIFLASLVSFGNKLKVEQTLKTESLVQLHKYCIEISEWWNGQEREKQSKLDDEDAMYIYKGKEKQMELTDEEQEAYDIDTTFPTFEGEFQDLEAVVCLEDGFKGRKTTPEDKLSDCGELTLEDLGVFLDVHACAVSHVGNSWTAKKNDTAFQVDFVGPFMNLFEIGCFGFIEGNFVSYCDREDEREFIVGANVATHQLSLENKQSTWDPITYDFYHDSNISEAQKLQGVFTGMKDRASNLLMEWPDQPALQQIKKIIARIESFRLDSPLMKFLTGLELLLGTAQEWESIASQRVSIAVHLAEITNLIICWRKLELRFWKNLSEHCLRREQSEAKKWWIHLFSTTVEIISENFVETPNLILKLFHQYMESSPLGQYSTRLHLLENLHRHIVLLESHGLVKLTPFLQPYIWNSICYYKQFNEQVTSKLNSLKIPIEKKIKDFVKISRWNDANFYALKDSVQKSQKMLNKLISEYKRVLKTPVTTVLVAEIGTETLKAEKSKISKFKMDLYVLPAEIMDNFRPEEDIVQEFSAKIVRQKRFKKLPRLYLKARKLAASAFETTGELCRDNVNSLDELTATVIDKVHELQNIKVPDKGDQRKKALHHVHNLRRKNLAELFKTLQGFNLSYKRGMIHIQNFDNDIKVPYDFLTEPMDLAAGWSHFLVDKKKVSPEKELISAWSGCEEYFQKCIARISAMTKSFQHPSKELGSNIIDRCKGFVADLFTVLCEQKSSIGSFNKHLWNLKVLTELTLMENDPSSTENWGKRFHDLACIVEYEISQYRVVFESLTDVPHVMKENLLGSVQILLKKSEDVKLHLRDFFTALTIPLVLSRSVSLEVLQKCEELFVDISECMLDLQNSLITNSILADKIGNLSDTVTALLQDFKSSNQSPTNNITTSMKVKIRFRNSTNMVLESMLLSFQKLQSVTELRNDETKIQKSKALETMQCFDLEKVVKGCKQIRSTMTKTTGEDYSRMCQIFVGLKPLIQQYSKTGQFYLKSMVEYHRESCKLLSVLSAVFGTLAQKGFCLPSDYKEEAMEEGPEMDSKSGMGLGEGETTSDAQDVSDRIESEDQLEDTMKAGEKMEPADKDLNDDEKGVEMGEDFEGKQQEKQERDKDGDDDSNKSESEGEEDLDKQMGDIDGEKEDALDEQMWGGSSDEEDEEMRDEKEDKGKGVPQGSEPELAPKDPSLEEEKEQPESDSNPEEDNKKEQNKKEYNEMDDGEINDDQVDPYHGENAPEEEPEALDLPDDLQLDDAEAKEDEGQEENPFDLDAKDREDFLEVEETPEDEQNEEGQKEEPPEDENGDDSAPVNVELPSQDENVEESNDNKDDSGEIEEQMDVEENTEGENPEEEDAFNKGSEIQETEDAPEPSKEEKEAPNAQNSNAKDQSQQVKEDHAKMQSVQEEQDSANNEQSTGQVESEEGVGQEGQAQNQDKSQATKSENEKDATRKPGETDSERALASEQSTKTRLKTVKQQNEKLSEEEVGDVENKDDMNQKEADLYQHIKSAEKSDALTVDNATQEQAEKQPKAQSIEPSEELPKIDDQEESGKDSDSEMDDMDEAALEINKPDLIKGLPQEKKRSKREQKSEEENEEKMEVEGEKIATYGVQRPAETVFHTQFNLLEEKMENDDENFELDMNLADNMTTLSTEDMSSMSQWHELDRKTMPLSQELCEQLRLILEPTQASRLKGDYKTGKRLNMRKVIPYIASGFRKDKIWLRRTQPSKREYQIVLALDDSASMNDNQSKQMAFSAVAVVARALTFLEAGKLAVASFGEDVQLLHPFEEPFTDFSGARLMQKFTFAQRRTRIVQLMEYSSALFNHAKTMSGGSSAPVETAQLLVIVSDGRAVCHEGSDIVKKAVRKAREQNIFIVFVIVDNPESQHSILDIQQPVFGTDNTVKFVKYMDNFPFPFYLILRDLSALPSVLSDALRQWFELVTSSSR